MRSLPPPRRSRARSLRRLLRYLYSLMTLHFIFHKHHNNTIVIKRRLSPFHRSSRRYKVKLRKRGKRLHWYHIHRGKANIVLSARALGELSRELEQMGLGQEGADPQIKRRKKSKTIRFRQRARSVLRLRVLARRALHLMRVRRWHMRKERSIRAVGL